MWRGLGKWAHIGFKFQHFLVSSFKVSAAFQPCSLLLPTLQGSPADGSVLSWHVLCDLGYPKAP